MASGYFESATGTNLEIGVEWTSVPSVQDNSSSVRAKVYITHYDIYCAALSGSYVSVGDRTAYFTAAVSSSDTSHQKTYIADETFSAAHGADGKKTVKIAAGWVFNGTYNGHYIGTLEVSGDAVLDKIDRASEFSCPGTLTVGEPFELTVRPASLSFTHRVIIAAGGASWTGNVSSGTSLTVTPPASLADGITSSSSGSGTVKVETYKGNVKIGETTKNVTVRIPQSAPFLPDFTLNFIPSSDSAFVTVHSLVCADITEGTVTVTNAAAAHSATVSSVRVTYGTKSVSGATLEVGKLTAGDFTYSATVTDSRGYSTTKSGSVTVMPYGAPRAENAAVTKCDSAGADDGEGTYFKVFADSVCSDLGGVNSASMTLTVKTRGGAALGTWSIVSGTPAVVGGSFSHTSSYVAEITVTDTAGQSTVKRIVVPTSFVDLHVKRGKIRFGGYCERAGFECDYPARFNSSLSVGDDAVADFVTSTYTDGMWTVVKYYSGRAECFGASTENLFPAASGGLYAADVAPKSYPPGLFLSRPTAIVSAERGLASERGDGTSSSSPTVRIYFESGNAVSCEVSYLVRGVWRSAV
ncbi:MAG: hypothetical protein IJS45_05985 [Clostridia bacterium]|nr:hypothetical protein [Clostridia bacterium]